MEVGKLHATRILTALEFQVEALPVGVGRTADLLASDGDSSYLVEVKDKLEDEKFAQHRRDVLNSGELFEQCDTLAYNDRISGILFDALKQLEETPKDAGTFQLIWFHATGVDADLKSRQAFATF
jgi:hypothetical protein